MENGSKNHFKKIIQLDPNHAQGEYGTFIIMNRFRLKCKCRTCSSFPSSLEWYLINGNWFVTLSNQTVIKWLFTKEDSIAVAGLASQNCLSCNGTNFSVSQDCFVRFPPEIILFFSVLIISGMKCWSTFSVRSNYVVRNFIINSRHIVRVILKITHLSQLFTFLPNLLITISHA